MAIKDIQYMKSGRSISPVEIRIIQDTVSEKYQTGRCEISRTICKRLNWFSENGKPKAWVCRELLIQLERDGLVNLPKPGPTSINRFKKKNFETDFTAPNMIYKGKLSDFPKPVFNCVNSSYENSFWGHLVSRYHHLGYRGVMGRFLKYIIYMDDLPVSCLGWSGAALSVTSRDKWIGWNIEQKKSKLKHIVNNFRFVIFPWVNIKYLASHLLSKNIPLLRKDWKARYNVDVHLLETFVDKDRFSGTCYRASNWTYVGETKGYARKKEGYVKQGLKKDVYLYPIDLEGLKLRTSDTS